MDIVQEFIARYWREFDFYREVSRLCYQQCESGLEASGIRALVTFRAKRPDKLERKLKQRASIREYQSINDIYDDIIDLAGVRIAIYFPNDRHEVDKFIRAQFDLAESPKEFPAGSASPSYEKRFSGYWANHYRVRLRPTTLSESQKRYADTRIEIQVASVLMHAWAEVEHDLVYKPQSGSLSQDEYAILDELNGLVLAGEIALERLQRAVENRVKDLGAPFSNHYELASYLYESMRPRLRDIPDEPVMGRVDMLFRLLQRARLDRPEDIAPFVDFLDADTESRPIADQIIDQILAANSDLYQVYTEIRSEETTGIPYISEQKTIEYQKYQDVIGFFLSNWIRFEMVMREIAQIIHPSLPAYRSLLPNAIQSLRIFDQETIYEIEHIRRLRNNLVHGVEFPNPEVLMQAGEALDRILEKLRSHENEQVREIARGSIAPSVSVIPSYKADIHLKAMEQDFRTSIGISIPHPLPKFRGIRWHQSGYDEQGVPDCGSLWVRVEITNVGLEAGLLEWELGEVKLPPPFDPDQIHINFYPPRRVEGRPLPFTADLYLYVPFMEQDPQIFAQALKALVESNAHYRIVIRYWTKGAEGKSEARELLIGGDFRGFYQKLFEHWENRGFKDLADEARLPDSLIL